MATQSPQATDRLFGRTGWSYVNIIRGPVIGPQPRLAKGTGKTARRNTKSGIDAQIPGYLASSDYVPTPLEYSPTNQQDFTRKIPRSIATGDNGRQVVGTYNPHDFTPGQRFFHHNRSAANWQVIEFPPSFRNTLQWQQVQRYRVNSLTVSARPLAANEYFLGYQVQSGIQSQIGQNSLGYMGSV